LGNRVLKGSWRCRRLPDRLRGRRRRHRGDRFHRSSGVAAASRQCRPSRRTV